MSGHLGVPYCAMSVCFAVFQADVDKWKSLGKSSERTLPGLMNVLQSESRPEAAQPEVCAAYQCWLPQTAAMHCVEMLCIACQGQNAVTCDASICRELLFAAQVYIALPLAA